MKRGVVALGEFEPAGGDDLGGRDGGAREGERSEAFTSGSDAWSSRQTEDCRYDDENRLLAQKRVQVFAPFERGLEPLYHFKFGLGGSTLYDLPGAVYIYSRL